MSDNAMIAPLRIANEAFLVSSMIDRCPKTMMLRELVVNGLEAAQQAQAAQRQVVIGSRIHEGSRKLCIWNTGPGMTAVELLQITDLASSLRKQNSLDQNFGMGAKVASLPSNRHGLRYRSCAEGHVSEVMLGFRDGTYGRLRVGPDNAEVRDTTEECGAEGGYNLSLDWTEVLLCGNQPDQDTVSEPYGAAPKVAPDWIARYLENRFFRLPPSVTLTLMPVIWGGATPRNLVGLDDRRTQFGRTDTCIAPNGIKIHYFYDPPMGRGTRSAAGAIASSTSRGAVVFRDEMYDVRGGDIWLNDAPLYGIPFGAKYCSVFVELPDDYPVGAEAYRQFLRFRGNDQRQVFLADFATLVRTHMPGWLVELIRRFGPSQANYVSEISSELKALLTALGVAPQAPVSNLPNLPSKLAPPKLAPAQPPAIDKQAPQQPKQPPIERPPEIIGLRTEELIKERGISGRAAKFYPQSHQIFINLNYPSIGEMAAALVAECEVQGPASEEEVRRIATEVAEWSLTKRIARFLVYSLSKKGRGWRPEEVTRGQSTESLSLIADDWASAMDMAKLRFRDDLLKRYPAIKAVSSVAA